MSKLSGHGDQTKRRMVRMGLHENLKTGLWFKCTVTATKLENIMINHTKKNVHVKRSTAKYQTMQNMYGILEIWELYAVSLQSNKN